MMDRKVNLFGDFGILFDKNGRKETNENDSKVAC